MDELDELELFEYLAEEFESLSKHKEIFGDSLDDMLDE